jgi:putative glutamine amidotransferase
MSKLIAISTGLKDVEMAPGNIPCVVINNDFVKACNNFGNNAVIFGPHENSELVDISKFDAIVISGGGDINPATYGEDKIEKTIRVSDFRDSTELAMLKSAEENNVKTLAICRGHQLLNIYKGGSLYQDLKDNGFTQIDHEKPFKDARSHVHDVNIETNSKLHTIIQENEIKVNSIHHQAINKLGHELKITAKSPDGVIEGIELTNNWDALGVQWHPENMLEDPVSIKLFEWLNS